jgi:hypothetical protein
MGITRRTLNLSNQGNSGKITAIPTNLPKYDEYLYGVRQGTMVNLFAETSTGKTALGRHLYIHTPYEYFLKINDPAKFDVLILDFSLEIAAEQNLAAAISRRAYLDYQRVIPPAAIFGWGTNKLTEDQAKIVTDLGVYFEEFEKKLVVMDGEINPSTYHDVLFEAARRNGKFSNPDAKYISDAGVYTPNNPNLYVITVVDTVNLTEMEQGHTTVKSAIDRISRISVLFRNKCNFFICILQQINSDLASTDRARHGILSPKLTDGEDSKRPSKDSDIVLGMFDPMRHLKPDETMFRGYDVSILQSWLKTLHILKHRQGVNNKYFALKAYGACSYYEQLPSAKDMTEQDYIRSTKY